MEKFMPGWQFKNLTTDSKIFYSSMIFILFWFMLIILNSCTSSIYQYRKHYDEIKPRVTHVLAVTEMGDTLKIPIESIKPNIVYNVIGYDYMRPNVYYSAYEDYYSNYYNNYYNRGYWYNHQYIYNPYSNLNAGSIGGALIGIQNINPTFQISSPLSSGSYSGTSGFSGNPATYNPAAHNPVTSGGKTKKKN
jgi:hypothetical protein